VSYVTKKEKSLSSELPVFDTSHGLNKNLEKVISLLNK
jgi:hypothetical protein